MVVESQLPSFIIIFPTEQPCASISWPSAPLLKNIFDIITGINKEGVTILLVEPNVYQSLPISDRAYVMETGRFVLTGKGDELLNNDHIKKAFLGM